MSIKKLQLLVVGIAFAALFFAGCASSQIKARKEQRDKIVQNSKIYCDFINGDVYPDIDVALNLEMAKRCDSDRPMTITNYRSPSEATGIVFCCSIRREPHHEQSLGQAPVPSPMHPAAAPAAPVKEEKH